MQRGLCGGGKLGGRVHSRHDPGHSCLAGRQLRVLSRPYPALYGRTRTRLLRAAGEPAGDEELEHHATGDEERFERDAERLMGQMGGEMDEEEAGQMLEGLEGFDEEALRNLDQDPELMGADTMGQDEDDEGEYADSLRVPTPSSEASTSGSDPDGDKYPPQPERGYYAYELFAKAALEEVAVYLHEKFPEACLFGLQSEIERVLPGDLYCCEPLDLDDVPDLVQQAVQAQAAAVLLPEQAYSMSSVRESVPEDFPVLYAGDVMELAQRLAVAFYDAPSRDLLVVGVTGSHGKTTVSWLIRGILEEMEQVTGMIGTVEYAIAEDRLDEDGELWEPREEDPSADRESSVPFMVTPYAGKYTVPATTPPGLQVQKLLAGVRDRGGTCAVVECSSHAMANRELDWLEVGVVVHARLSLSGEVSPRMQQQLRAELSLFEKLYDPTTQAAVINIDDPAADVVKAAASAVPVVTYGIENPDADVYAETAKMDIWESEVIVRTPLGKLQIITPLLGKHNVYNILAAVATGICLKLPLTHKCFQK
ncbi:Mur ligase [Dunaliella salina]|uniref:Mur ligase n=1 Tax=Dunaliella salina TaxID=3046 RepID=A0ABQ7GE49_DUNSA|nr:Mur ligase [Dunaliella salina]|eukprot:KAF5832882.1 Mur ligase [Dunaliella salina]